MLGAGHDCPSLPLLRGLPWTLVLRAVAVGAGSCLGSHPAPPAHYTDEQTGALGSKGTCPRSYRGQLVSGARQVQILTASTLEGLLIFLSLDFIICEMGVAHPT